MPSVKGAIAAPSAAVLNDEGRTYVWVADAGAVERRLIQVGVSTDGFVQVTEGLQPGEKVVVEGLGGLMDGSPIEVTEGS